MHRYENVANRLHDVQCHDKVTIHDNFLRDMAASIEMVREFLYEVHTMKPFNSEDSFERAEEVKTKNTLVREFLDSLESLVESQQLLVNMKMEAITDLERTMRDIATEALTYEVSMKRSEKECTEMIEGLEKQKKDAEAKAMKRVEGAQSELQSEMSSIIHDRLKEVLKQVSRDEMGDMALRNEIFERIDALKDEKRLPQPSREALSDVHLSMQSRTPSLSASSPTASYPLDDIVVKSVDWKPELNLLSVSSMCDQRISDLTARVTQMLNLRRQQQQHHSRQHRSDVHFGYRLGQQLQHRHHPAYNHGWRRVGTPSASHRGMPVSVVSAGVLSPPTTMGRRYIGFISPTMAIETMPMKRSGQNAKDTLTLIEEFRARMLRIQNYVNLPNVAKDVARSTLAEMLYAAHAIQQASGVKYDEIPISDHDHYRHHVSNSGTSPNTGGVFPWSWSWLWRLSTQPTPPKMNDRDAQEALLFVQEFRARILGVLMMNTAFLPLEAKEVFIRTRERLIEAAHAIKDTSNLDYEIPMKDTHSHSKNNRRGVAGGATHRQRMAHHRGTNRRMRQSRGGWRR